DRFQASPGHAAGRPAPYSAEDPCRNTARRRAGIVREADASLSRIGGGCAQTGSEPVFTACCKQAPLICQVKDIDLSSLLDARAVLAKYWGFSDFRSGQKKA